MNHHDPLVLIFARNMFYKRLYILILACFTMSLIMIGTLSGVIMFLWGHPTQPIFFATDSIGRLLKIIPVDQPNMSAEEAAAWTVKAVQVAMSYNYVAYRSNLQNSQKYFTSYGWSNFMKALIASNNLPALTSKKLIITAQVTDKPKLITQGILGGAYAWKFEMPVLVTFWQPPYDQTPATKFVNNYNVSVIVQRQPILQSDQGVGIVQLISAPIASTQPPQLQLPPSG